LEFEENLVFGEAGPGDLGGPGVGPASFEDLVG
jgi:hypothetical protein